MDSGDGFVQQGPELDHLTQFLEVFINARRLALAMTVWMFYDLLLASSDLYASFASPRWSLGRILFYLNRFVSPVMMLIHTLSLSILHPLPWFCSVAPWAMMLGNWLVVFCIGATLIARINAVWQERWVLIGVMATFASIFCGNIACLAYITSKSHAIPSPLPMPFTGCFWNPMSKLLWLGLVTTGLWETMCVILTLWKAWKAESKRETPILYAILYDGVLYYFSAITIKAFTIVAGYYMQIRAFGASNAILALTSMLCTQLYIRLRSVAASESPMGTSDAAADGTQSQLAGAQRLCPHLQNLWAFDKPLPPIPVHVAHPP